MTLSEGERGGSAEDVAENPFLQGCAWIDGDYVAIAEAKIPILDLGFVRSDVTYDVVAVWEGRFFRLQDHLSRLERSCERIRMPLPVDRDQLSQILTELVCRSTLRNAYVAAIVTRGVPAFGERDLRRVKPRLYAYVIPYVWIVKPELQERGTDVVVARNTQRISPTAVDPTVKNFHWGDLVRGLFEAYDRGAWLPILTDDHGNITEGPGFNVFAVEGQSLYTPNDGVLRGITRLTAIEIAREQQLNVRLGALPAALLYQADEIFLTSTAGGVMSVATLDGKPVGDGVEGPITRAIRDRYWELHLDPGYTTEVNYEGIRESFAG